MLDKSCVIHSNSILIITVIKSISIFSFVHNLPQMLGCIYDELMQPYPKELESVMSPDQSTGDSSVFNQSLQSCGGDTSISQPVSVVSDVLLNRPERNSRYVDLGLIHHYREVIVVMIIW